MFTRQHYKAIGAIIAKRLPNRGLKTRIIADFIDLFEADNPRFDAHKFVDACCEAKLDNP